MLSPVLSFTTEEIWQAMRSIDGALCQSVFLSDWPVADPKWEDTSLSAPWEQVLLLRGAMSKALEKVRVEGKIGHSLEATIIAEKGKFKEIAERFSDEDWAMFLITSGFRWVETLPDKTSAVVDEETGLTLLVERTTGHKCPRCWKYSGEIDENGLCMRCSSVLAQ